MADKDQGDGPSLELPSFGFRRKKKPDPAPEPEPEPEPAAEVPTEEPVAAQPEGAEPPEPVEPEPVAPGPVAPEPVAPELAPAPEPAARAAEQMVEPEYAENPETGSHDPTTGDAGHTAVLPAQDGPVARELQRKREPIEWRFPGLGALQAVLVVGAIIGLLAIVFMFASLKLCELLRGTDSCGGPGLLLLLATALVLIYIGGWLLRGFRIADPGSTSFLAVALVGVIAMLFFLDVIYSWWMIIVIPIVAMGAYALSWWVTTAIVETND